VLSSTDKIRVCVRKRPRSTREMKRNEADVVKIRGRQTVVVEELKVAVDLTKFIQQVCMQFGQYVTQRFLDPEGGSEKATLVVVVVVVVGISSLKIPKAFLIRSGVQRNFANAFVLIFPTDVPSQIFYLFSD